MFLEYVKNGFLIGWYFIPSKYDMCFRHSIITTKASGNNSVMTIQREISAHHTDCFWLVWGLLNKFLRVGSMAPYTSAPVKHPSRVYTAWNIRHANTMHTTQYIVLNGLQLTCSNVPTPHLSEHHTRTLQQHNNTMKIKPLTHYNNQLTSCIMYTFIWQVETEAGNYYYQFH